MRAAVLSLIVAVLAGVFAWWLDRRAFLAGYLAAWWFLAGISMGGLANIWLHNLTGGQWGEVIRGPVLAMTRHVWILALLLLPVLAGIRELYPWAAEAGAEAARWSGELSAPSFKRTWLTPAFFLARSIVTLLLWVALAWATRRPAWQRSKTFSALALIVYGVSVSVAAFDWIMSLMPLWYSSVFGWLTGVSQMLAGMAAAIVVLAYGGARLSAGLFRDLGNLLLMYVMTWAYLAFVQFLIIWAENLPHEISWYLARSQGIWPAVAWILAICLFFAPLLILLFRQVKDSAKWLGRLSAFVLLMQLLDCWWLVLPSVPVSLSRWGWTVPLSVAVLGTVAWLTAGRPALRQAGKERA